MPLTSSGSWATCGGGTLPGLETCQVDVTSEASLTAAARGQLREEAERHLRALVGRDDAVLRDDQWTAIEALVAAGIINGMGSAGPIFQEQLLRVAMTAAGFSGGEAEELRRAKGG